MWPFKKKETVSAPVRYYITLDGYDVYRVIPGSWDRTDNIGPEWSTVSLYFGRKTFVNMTQVLAAIQEFEEYHRKSKQITIREVF
jgi:hypothetical protein